MAFTDDVKARIQERWTEVKAQIQATWAELTDDDLANGEFDPDGLVQRISAKVNEAADAVEAKITEIVNSL
jgi:uncharacterized protein YjbJ (UPF0337 family)